MSVHAWSCTHTYQIDKKFVFWGIWYLLSTKYLLKTQYLQLYTLSNWSNLEHFVKSERRPKSDFSQEFSSRRRALRKDTPFISTLKENLGQKIAKMWKFFRKINLIWAVVGKQIHFINKMDFTSTIFTYFPKKVLNWVALWSWARLTIRTNMPIAKQNKNQQTERNGEKTKKI